MLTEHLLCLFWYACFVVVVGWVLFFDVCGCFSFFHLVSDCGMSAVWNLVLRKILFVTCKQDFAEVNPKSLSLSDVTVSLHVPVPCLPDS